MSEDKTERTFESPMTPQTSFDHAFLNAESADTDTQIQTFYQVFIDEIFYLLIDEEALPVDSDTVKPTLVSVEGTQTALAFDTQERLAEFVDKPSNFVTLTGRALVKMFVAKDVQIGLNLGVAPSSLVINSTVLQMLWQDLSQNFEPLDKDDLSDITVAEPAKASDALVKSLHMHLELWHDVLDEALLVQAQLKDHEKMSFILCLVYKDSDAIKPEQEEDLLQQLSGASMQYALSDDVDGINICILEPCKRLDCDDRLLNAARKYGLNFYADEDESNTQYLH